MTNEEAETMIQECATKLGEHFDAVQIMVSWNEEGLSMCARRGSGNWYARQGMAHEFITSDVAQKNARHLAHAMKPPPEDTAP